MGDWRRWGSLLCALCLTFCVATVGEVARRGFAQQRRRVSKIEVDFLTAVRSGNFSGVAALNEAHPGRDLTNAASPGGTPAIWSAALRDDVGMVQYLLNHGADANKRNRNGTTAAYVAAQNGDVQLLELLIEAGADVNIASVWSSTPLSVAAHEGNVEVVGRLLMENITASLNLPLRPSRQTPLWSAAHNGHTDVVQILLEHGADLDVLDASGSSALWAASQEGRDKIVGLLLDFGANPNATNNNGSTPLHAAAAFCHRPVILRLTQSYIMAIKVKDQDRRVPADLLCIGREIGVDEYVWMQYHVVPGVAAIRLDLFSVFIDYIQNTTRPHLPILRNRQNLLHVAAVYGNTQAVDYLIRKHPDMMGKRDMQGKRPMDSIGEFAQLTTEQEDEILEMFLASDSTVVIVEESSISEGGLSTGGILGIVVSSAMFVLLLLLLSVLCLRQRGVGTERWNVHSNPTARDKHRKKAKKQFPVFDTDASEREKKLPQPIIGVDPGETPLDWAPSDRFQLLSSEDLDIADEIYDLSAYESLQLGQPPLYHQRSQRSGRYPDEGPSNLAASQGLFDPTLPHDLQYFNISESTVNDSSTGNTTGNTIEIHSEMLASWSTAPHDPGCHSISDQEITEASTAEDTATPRLTYLDFEEIKDLRAAVSVRRGTVKKQPPES